MTILFYLLHSNITSTSFAGPCDAGMMSSTGSYPCVDCGAGTYQSASGQTKCLSCPKGEYLINIGTVRGFLVKSA